MYSTIVSRNLEISLQKRIRRQSPAMKKAAAIVTSEGGITSHAAIVSRELGIPSIIGTKIATEVLRDGDIVEVNANHGWVKKLK
ncbi:MAG: pyruvate, water dikinase [Candidatus Magasanikbacteria bacterium]|nr:pyruvate, water dikinase [Candidatus Magasanikbacteria bacterium]